MNGKQILILTNNVAPYRHPLFSLITEKFKGRGSETVIWFMREREAFRDWEVRQNEMGYDYEILSGMHFGLKKFREIHFNPSICWKMVRLHPDIVIIGGYNSVSSWIALFYCKLFRKKSVMWSGSIKSSSKLNNLFVTTLKKIFIRSCDAYVSYGSKAAEFLELYGALPSKIFVGCNVGDINFYRDKILYDFQYKKSLVVNLIFVGHLEREKGIFNLIEALNLVESNSWHLYIVGSGTKELEIKNLCNKYKFIEKITFAGFRQKEDLSDYYRKGDIFILPSFADKFSIVMSEALASGLFVIASKYDGASFDIVKEGENGYITDPHEIETLAACIDRAISIVPQMPSKQIISDSVASKMELYAQQFINAADFVFGVRE